MMDPSPNGGTRRNNRKRRNRSASAGSGDQRGGNTNAAPGRRRKRRRRTKGNGTNGHARDMRQTEPIQDHSSVLGSRVIQKRKREQPEGPPGAFDLFCAYHLGVTADDGYSRPSLDSTARRFGITPEEVKDLLKEYAIDAESIEQTSFDLEGAVLDVKLAPEGISRTEIARDHFEELSACQTQE
jgi:hypothetical protein